MNRLSVLLKKEWLDASRSYKLIWLPVAFMILGMLQPLSTYYLPDILRAVGGVPEGMELLFPEFSGEEVLASTLSDQFDQLGMMIVVIGMMSMVIADKNGGMLAFMLTRSTTLTEYLLSKWIAHLALLALSLGAGLLMSWTYIALLYNTVPLGTLLLAFLIYCLWGGVVVTLTLMLSSLLTRSAGVAVAGIAVVMFLKVATLAGGAWHTMNPASLSDHVASLIVTGSLPSATYWSGLIAVVLIAVFFGIARWRLSKEELPAM